MMLPSLARLPLSLGTNGADRAPVRLVVGQQYTVHRKTSTGGEVYITFECIAIADDNQEPLDRVKIVSVKEVNTVTNYAEWLPRGREFYFFQHRFWTIDHEKAVFQMRVAFKMSEIAD